MVHIISIQERSTQADGFGAVVSFDHGPEHHVNIRNPFSSEEEERLAWYFEEYLHFPFVKQVQFKAAAESITIYGRVLFQQVFGSNLHVNHHYRTAVQSGL